MGIICKNLTFALLTCKVFYFCMLIIIQLTEQITNCQGRVVEVLVGTATDDCFIYANTYDLTAYPQ